MTTQTLTLTDFLLGRIAEDEAFYADEFYMQYLDIRDKMLAECEAKRRIVALHNPCDDWSYGDPAGCPELTTLAAVYADHPDYREEWKP